MKQNEESQVIMSDNLIKARNTLSLNEIKLLRIAISKINDQQFGHYAITIKHLAFLLGVKEDAHIYRKAKKMINNLFREFLVIEKDSDLEIIQLMDDATYSDGVITIRLHNDLKTHLLGLKQDFTVYPLKNVLMLKTVYAVRLYELIQMELYDVQVQKNQSVEVELTVDEIRVATNTTDKYLQTGIFRARVVESAVKEINKKLDMYITIDNIKEGKKVIAFRFFVESKESYRIKKNLLEKLENF